MAIPQPTRRFTIVLAALAVAIGSYAALLGSRSWHSEFAFEKYEGFLGLGRSDGVSAAKDFVQLFPIGTPLDRYKQYFDQIGGRCFQLPKDRANELICIYEHMRYPPLPVMYTTWAVDIDYDPSTGFSTRIKLTPGLEGL